MIESRGSCLRRCSGDGGGTSRSKWWRGERTVGWRVVVEAGGGSRDSVGKMRGDWAGGWSGRGSEGGGVSGATTWEGVLSVGARGSVPERQASGTDWSDVGEGGIIYSRRTSLKVLGHGYMFEVWILIFSGSDITIQIRTCGFGVI